MKKQMRKLLVCLLFITLILSLVSCTSESKKETVKSEVTSSQEQENNALEENKAEDKANDDKANEDKTKENKKQETAPIVKKKIVVIDPGHSSKGNKGTEKQSPDSDIMKIKDPGGAQGITSGTPEYVVAMSVSVKLKRLLEQHGITVIMTKTQDSESPGNIDRAETGNKNNADLAIRIHCDSSDSQSARGASMLVPAPVGYAKAINTVSRKYGQVILKDLVSTAGMSNRGVVERNDLTGFNWSKVPVVLVEMGFMSNPEEDRLLNDDSYQNKLAEGLYNGIIEALQA